MLTSKAREQSIEIALVIRVTGVLWQQPVLARNTSQMSHNTAQWVNQMALCGFL